MSKGTPTSGLKPYNQGLSAARCSSKELSYLLGVPEVIPGEDRCLR